MYIVVNPYTKCTVDVVKMSYFRNTLQMPRLWGFCPSGQIGRCPRGRVSGGRLSGGRCPSTRSLARRRHDLYFVLYWIQTLQRTRSLSSGHTSLVSWTIHTGGRREL